MTNRGLILGAVACISTLVGCVAPEPVGDEVEFRTEQVEDAWWAPDPEYPGDGNIEVREGGDDDGPDSILWDLDGGHVARELDTGVVEDVLYVEDNELWSTGLVSRSVDAAPTCTVEREEHPAGDVHRLVDDTGEVVFTLWNRYVFAGEVGLPTAPRVRRSRRLQRRLVMSFAGRRVHDGGWWQGDVLARASTPIGRANPVRRLLVAAVLGGECQDQ